MNKPFSWIDFILGVIAGAGIVLFMQLVTPAWQDIPGTGGLTRVQLAEMLYECDRQSRKPEGYCVADVNIRPIEVIE